MLPYLTPFIVSDIPFSSRGVFALLALAVVVARFILIRHVPVPGVSRPAPSMD